MEFFFDSVFFSFIFFFAYENEICTILISRIANFHRARFTIRYLIWQRRVAARILGARVWQPCRVVAVAAVVVVVVALNIGQFAQTFLTHVANKQHAGKQAAGNKLAKTKLGLL